MLSPVRLGDFWRITLDRPMVQDLARFTKEFISLLWFIPRVTAIPANVAKYLAHPLILIVPSVAKSNAQHNS